MMMQTAWSFEELQTRSLRAAFSGITASFDPRAFKAAFPTNEHFHTIFGSGVVAEAFTGPMVRPFKTDMHRMFTPDNDFFDIEFGLENEASSDAVVLICHGLESHTKAPLVTNMAAAMHSKGFQTVLVGLRGCNGEDNATSRVYHLGWTTDLSLTVDAVRKRFPHKKIYVSGFSLGGNICLKFLGELGDLALDRGVYGAVACCVPFDPVASQDKLAKGFNKAVYSGNLLRSLKKKAELKIKAFPGTFDIESIRQCSTIGDFDEAFICPIYGFRDKLDYYKSSGAKWWLPKIRVPAISINAIDDPFIDAPSLPRQCDLPAGVPVRLCYTENGGHCGFISSDKDEAAHGWLAEEVALAMLHIHRGISADLDGFLGMTRS
jgi:predicted alpha/beta-fold hydrolase